MKWEFVFNGRFVSPGTPITDVYVVAASGGYRFFLFNGEVFFIYAKKPASGDPYENTGLKVTDLV
jgi:hypothetical protein